MIFLPELSTFTPEKEAGQELIVGKAQYGQRLNQKPRVVNIQRSLPERTT